MKVNVRNIMQVAKVTKAVSAQTCMGVYSFSVCYNFCSDFSSETACGPPREPPQTNGGPWSTV
jgi:hypothetical protein